MALALERVPTRAELVALLRTRKAANPSPVTRLIEASKLRGFFDVDLQPPTPRRARQRKLDPVEQVKRAQAAGLPVRSATVTADSVVLTFGEAETPDATANETAADIRKLI